MNYSDLVAEVPPGWVAWFALWHEHGEHVLVSELV
jgi:hypothetical protein